MSLLPHNYFQYKKGIENSVTFNWDSAKNQKFKGEFNTLRAYKENDIVYLGGALLTALTNVPVGAFNSVDWTSTNDLLDYVGYLPNDTTLSVVTDSTDGSTVLDQEALGVFGKTFDVSTDGEVLVSSVTYSNNKANGVVVYRINNGFFEFDQLIEAPSKTIGFADSISISDDGMSLVISAPFDDNINADQGIVYVYKQVSGKFQLTQTLNSPKNERAEQFGFAVSYDGTTLAIGSKNADSIFDTTFDNSLSTFDNNFTKFRTTNVDDGVVYVYENVGGKLLYADIIQLDNDNVNYFGRNIVSKQNHVYIGLPRLSNPTTKGNLVDYRVPTKVWSTIRTPKDPGDVTKIKKVTLYNTKTKKLLAYLDYIDPLQGKIAGVAEQELRYKTYYDPATYTDGSNVVVDKLNSWGVNQVGQLWWDLTNAKFINPVSYTHLTLPTTPYV